MNEESIISVVHIVINLITFTTEESRNRLVTEKWIATQIWNKHLMRKSI